MIHKLINDRPRDNWYKQIVDRQIVKDVARQIVTFRYRHKSQQIGDR